ncbi:hypothetical protein KAR34_11175 [bacterium]|nr:hypothetical protein [bacterium]
MDEVTIKSSRSSFIASEHLSFDVRFSALGKISSFYVRRSECLSQRENLAQGS